MLSKQLADTIVQQTMVHLKRNLNVMDTNGMILASGESDRIERIHEGAAYVAKTGEELWITEDNLHEWHGAKPGVNMPIRFQQALVGVIGITGDSKELKDIATLVQMTTEMMVHQSLITSQAAWKQKLKELLFEELIGNGPITPLVLERLSLLEFHTKGPFIILLIQSDNFQLTSKRLIEQMEDLFKKNTVLIGHSQLNEIFVLHSATDEKILQSKLNRFLKTIKKSNSVRVGVGYPVNDLEGIHHSYVSAKNALQFGNPHQPLIYFNDIELLTLLKSNSNTNSKRYSERILNGLNDQLVHTLTVYFELNLNTLESSGVLSIHRHTMTYRLKKIEEITGYNPSVFHDALVLKIALLLV
ncbi:CdaR family transcriptional regulator [Sporosarcina sp. FA9]|uniref:CdaR family transcriptional regulator n=1 Tax=Sporosarcina sp. FA9 TaxID=3413030 RepID=UPI003F65DC20